jgi:uncharacterized glyoxalase superfamily protein PhnB
MLKSAIPVLHVSSAKAAEEFYCERLGFARRFAYRVDEGKKDPCYMGVTRDEVWLHRSSLSGDGMPDGAVCVIVDDVDALHAELVANGVAIDLEPMDQTWCNREMYMKDADRNSIRFIQEGSG